MSAGLATEGMDPMFDLPAPPPRKVARGSVIGGHVDVWVAQELGGTAAADGLASALMAGRGQDDSNQGEK